MKLILLTLFLFTISSAHLIQTFDSISHRKDCYTQGLFFLNSTHLFQSCGLYNKSFFRVMEYNADPFQLEEIFVSKIPYETNIFLEGAVVFKNFIYILTWRQNIVYKLDPVSFQIVQKLRWGRQGWGLTHNNTHMFVTDGSDKIFVVDEQFKLLEQKLISFKNGRRARSLNELEYVNGYIYANIYFDHSIHKISYSKGEIIESFDGSLLVGQQKTKNKQLKSDEVFNGIAYDEKKEIFVLTGKNWDTIYQAEL